MDIKTDKNVIKAFILGVLVTAIFAGPIWLSHGLSKEEAAEMVVKKIYSDFGPDNYVVEIISTENFGDNLYKVDVNIKEVVSAKNISYLITKDGKEIIRGSEKMPEISGEVERIVVAEKKTGDVKPAPPTNDIHSIGPKDAKVTIVEYSDYQCPFCRRFREDTFNRILEAYPDDVKFIFKNFPLESIHPMAYPAAEAAECAGEQGHYWEYHDKLFGNSEWQDQGKAAFLTYAEELGLDIESFTQCIDDRKYKSKVDNDLKEGLKLGVRGTPAFIINGKLISGAQPFSVFKQEIDTILGVVQPPTPEPKPSSIVHEIGPADAKVTILEYSDYQCPFCKRFYDETYKKILEAYPNDVKIVFKDFPLSFHQMAYPAAEAAECAGAQGKYWEYHDKLFENQREWSISGRVSFEKYAEELGLDMESFKQCIETREFKDDVAADFREGQLKGVRGTPTFFINGKLLSGAQPFATFKNEIDLALEAAG
jgi:protein-disulfide isomerase